MQIYKYTCRKNIHFELKLILDRFLIFREFRFEKRKLCSVSKTFVLLLCPKTLPMNGEKTVCEIIFQERVIGLT